MAESLCCSPETTTALFIGYATAAAKLLQSCPALCDPRQKPTRLPCPWDFSGKNIGMGCYFLFQGILPTQGSNLYLLLGMQILYHGASWEAIEWIISK